jgi:hypothetical protein
MKEHIGIGILDIYDQEDLESCYSSIPEEYRDNVLIASATNNSIASNIAHKKFNEVSMATLRNWIISKFRIDGLKYIFIISNCFWLSYRLYITICVSIFVCIDF